jgi:hypothetical protein
MQGVASRAVELVRAQLTSESGIGARLSDMKDEGGYPMTFSALQVKSQHIGPDLAEIGPVRYPLVYVYCERVQNTMREKFRTFSGIVRVAVEVRVSQERLEGIEEQSRGLMEAVVATLLSHRGVWEQGVSFAGGLDITYSPVKRGGKNFLKPAKLVLDIDVSQG